MPLDYMQIIGTSFQTGTETIKTYATKVCKYNSNQYLMTQFLQAECCS